VSLLILLPGTATSQPVWHGLLQHLPPNDESAGQLEAVAYGSHRYVVTSSKEMDPPQILISHNLKAWFGLDLADEDLNYGGDTVQFDSPLYDVIFANGKFWATGEATILSSVDGVSWELAYRTLPMRILEIKYAAGVWVALAHQGESGWRIVYSTDGVTWTEKQVDVANIAVSGSLWAGVGRFNVVSTSRDGINWSAGPPVTGLGSVDGIAAGNGLFVATGIALESGVPFVWSTDGLAWTVGSISNLPSGARAASLRFWNITHGKIGFLALGQLEGQTGELKVFISGDGKAWTMHPAPLDFVWRTRVSYAGGLYFIAAPGRLFASEDGVNWTQRFGQ
jgi:hypothetical protein